jgi:hypothetical protein
MMMGVHSNLSNLKEKQEAKKDGATLVSNSGRGFHKGDALMDEFMIDYKHNARSFTLSLKAWKKLLKDAWGENRRSPAIKICYEDGTKVAIVEWEWFLELLELKKKEEEND